MKKIFQKNQIAITALAIMIAVAGYLNFTEQNTSSKLRFLVPALLPADILNLKIRNPAFANPQ